jgi:hydroxyethylthiazole kinase-like uncharacterized protein yjeF
MKIFTNAQIHELDEYTIEHEPITSIDLMERAARAIAKAISERWTSDTHIVTFAGPGNNGGDALAVARLLAAKGYKVYAYLFNVRDNLSAGCEINKKRLTEEECTVEFTEVSVNFDPPHLKSSDVVIDGLFGSGLNKPLAGGFSALVRYINHSHAKVVSIDVPSGLMTEDNTDNVKENIIRADLTLTLQAKKLCMLFADCQEFIGEVKVLDIRLSPDYIKKATAQYSLIEEQDIKAMLLHRNNFVHKGSMGTAMIIAGCRGMAGASVLAAKACLRAGAGKVIAHVPACNNTIMQISVPEVITQSGHDDDCFAEPIDTDRCNALGIGPGLGNDENTAIAMIAQLRRTRCPIVADADALNLLANHRAWLQQLPDDIILTPHPLELERLAGTMTVGDFDLLSHARQLASHINGYVILKGHHSALCMPNGHVVFNCTGNSGMATAGCGDVLTGIITGLLARGYDRHHACILGMYLHGLAGDIAVREIGKESLVAGDLITYLPKAFKHLYEE